MSDRYDAIAVSLTTRKVSRIYYRDQSRADAEAARDFAVIRRGVEEDMHVVTAAGLYQEGDDYNGPGLTS